ncbi:RRP12 family protein [Abortiporus biennis]
MADGLEVSLQKIRPHTSSNLPHQKTPATLLRALESTFVEQNTEKTPTAYFASLLTALDGTLQTTRATGPPLGDGDVLPAELYLLALVAPHVPHPVIRSNLNTIVSLTAPLFPILVPAAPPLRSQLSFYDAVYHALEKPQLEAHGLRQSFESILHLCLDPRPKVRKRAAELVKDVLASPPTPLIRHPYAERVAEWVKSSLAEVATGVPKFKGKKAAESEGSETAIHLLAFLRPVLPLLPSSTLPSITASLLAFPQLGNPYLSQSAYSILASLLETSIEDPANNIQDQLQEIVSVVLSSPPPITDTAISPVWSNVLGHAMLAYHKSDPIASSKKLIEVWQAVWSLLESTDAGVRKAAAQSLDLISRCFDSSMIQAALKEKNKSEYKSTLGKIITRVTKSLDALAYARSIPDILSVTSSLISNLRHREGSRSAPTTAEQLLMPLIVKIAELRIQKDFEFKENADAALNTAMSVIGPAVILQELPLNLDTVDRQSGKEPRAFLLPMLSQPHPSPLSHFVSYFVPLTERMFDLQLNAESEGRQSEAKVWSVLMNQIWGGLYGYCYGAPDLKEALTPEFAQILSQLLYSQEELRPTVLKALKITAESNVALSSRDETKMAKLPEAVRADPISQELAAANVAFLRTQVESWLAVLFNVFSTVGRNGQGMVGDAISVWASLAEEKEISKAYKKLSNLLKQNLAKAQAAANGPKDTESITAMTLDLILLMLPFLSTKDATALFQSCLSAEILESKDNAVQKRGYKILGKLVESGKVAIDAESVLQKLEKHLDGLSAAAKKDRIVLYSLLVPLLPPTSMHVIPSLIPEAVLGTKEPSEKARNAAFDLIVAMGRKMSEGGVVKRNLVDGMDEDGSGEAKASIEEYLTMIAGGLAGATPHMISATITAISRLVFEFNDSISPQMHTEIFSTLLVFLTSANREIVKSALGYIKLAIHTMPVELLRPHLKDIVTALLSWSHDHKNHFKAKVRHIFERLIRRFGWEDVYAVAPEEDSRKVLLNIKKRKDRAKKKRQAKNADDEDGDDVPSSKPVAGDAFEDVLYGSESELEDSDDEMETTQANRKGKPKGDSGSRLRVDDDEPMDLLSGVASRITNAKNQKRRKPGQEASKFKTDEDTGKMLIDEEDDDNDGGMEEDVTGTAYRETITSADGFTRGPNGKIKFNKDTKKRRRAEADDDVEMGDVEEGGGTKKSKKKAEPTFGREFKAKKAGGDVKKGGVDPYAYLSLSQAAKKKGRKERIGVAGKR